MSRVRWNDRRGELEAIVATGASVKQIAEHFGCRPDAVAAAMRRFNLIIDPVAATARRRALLDMINSTPEIKARANTPARAAKISAIRKRFWSDPANREAASAQRKALVAERPDLRQKARDAAVRSWDVRRERQRLESEAEAARAAEAARLAAMSPFERQLERVRKGAAISVRPVLTKSYDRTLGGISAGML